MSILGRCIVPGSADLLQNLPHRICVIDDDTGVRESLKILLESHGFDVVTFSSAAEFFSTPCDYRCLILDHNMPVTSGLELLELLRMSGIETPALLMIDKREPALVPRIGKVSACTVLRKPITESDLIRAVTAGHRAGAL